MARSPGDDASTPWQQTPSDGADFLMFVETPWSSSWMASDDLWRFTDSHFSLLHLWKVCSLIQTPLVLSFLFNAVWSGTEISDAPLHHPLPRSRGCLLTAPLVVSSVFQPPGARPLCPLPGTAYRTPRCPHSCSALLTGDHRLKPGRITDTRCLCVWCFAGTPSAQEMLSAFFPPSCSVAQSRALQPNPVTIPEHSSLIPTTACYRFPQTMRLCYNFSLAGGASIKLWTSKAVYGRTENFKLYNRQLPCPLPPSPPFNLWSVCRWVWLGAD